MATCSYQMWNLLRQQGGWPKYLLQDGSHRPTQQLIDSDEWKWTDVEVVCRDRERGREEGREEEGQGRGTLYCTHSYL